MDTNYTNNKNASNVCNKANATSIPNTRPYFRVVCSDINDVGAVFGKVLNLNNRIFPAGVSKIRIINCNNEKNGSNGYISDFILFNYDEDAADTGLTESQNLAVNLKIFKEFVGIKNGVYFKFLKKGEGKLTSADTVAVWPKSSIDRQVIVFIRDDFPDESIFNALCRDVLAVMGKTDINPKDIQNIRIPYMSIECNVKDKGCGIKDGKTKYKIAITSVVASFHFDDHAARTMESNGLRIHKDNTDNRDYPNIKRSVVFSVDDSPAGRSFLMTVQHFGTVSEVKENSNEG